MKYLYIKPKKLRSVLEEDEVDDHRKFDCVFYDHCLDHARTFRYVSFTCKNCINYNKVKK